MRCACLDSHASSFIRTMFCGCRCHRRSADPRFGLPPRPATKDETIAAITEAFIAHQESNSFKYLPPSLRDQFAMAALTGLLAVEAGDGDGVAFMDDDVARDAYMFADAMLAAREVKS
jgi:hypothetical protein